MDDNTRNEFLLKLKNLLKQYNVGIGFSVADGSDTYGLEDEKMIIFDNSKHWSDENRIILSVHGWHIDSSDIEVK